MRAYGFVEDRFRALRNDVSIQRMHSRLTAALQEEQARFMILAHYQFCDASEQASDPVPLSGAAILLHVLRLNPGLQADPESLDSVSVFDRETNIKETCKTLTSLTKASGLA